MKIVSWNVNGLRASIKSIGKDLKGLLDSLNADIICLQETKATRDQLDESTYSADGYNGYFSFCKTRGGYSGVVTFCRDAVTPVAAEEGLTGVLSSSRQDSVQCYAHTEDYTVEELTSLDAEGRSVITEHLTSAGARVVVVNVYCPMVENSSENQARMDYKLKFYSVLRERCSALEAAGKTVIVVGDLNFTRETKDSAYLQEDPSLLDKHHPSREWMEQFVISTPHVTSTQGCKLLDTFRFLHPTDDKAFTCWSTLLDCRKTNYGTRIDYVLCSRVLSEALRRAEVWQHVQGSDHCPVFAEFELLLESFNTQPSLSASYFSFGTQKKMSDFFSSGRKSGSETVSEIEPPPPKIRKTSSQNGRGRKTAKLPTSQTLFSFMKPSKQIDAEESTAKLDTEQGSEQCAIKQDTGQCAELQPTCSQDNQAGGDSSTELSQAWQSVFKGPPKAPLCAGHQEPCVLRTVKKQGPNINRQFWVCAKPHGSKSDPASRCDFFKWAKKK